ncbi:MAG TPA: DNA repair protein RadC [Kofleriaceae bacterium]|nr:DNA repair protein RadC [Kofleriaceae bacterium]
MQTTGRTSSQTVAPRAANASPAAVGNEERPAERLWSLQTTTVSDDELLGLLLGSGTPGRPSRQVASQLIAHVGSLHELASALPPELAEIPGVGFMRAARITAAFELARRVWSGPPPPRQMQSADDVYALLRPRVANLRQEVFIVIAIDARGQWIADFEVARGSVLSVEVFPREVFRPLIRVAAAAGVIAHNHPSGDPSPSPEDLLLTRRLREVATVVGIPLVDHVVVARDGFVSIAQEMGPEF